ncbi:MAG: mechanosensitive ion channel [Emcibacteraceae bacterium]|nr:mechanosensitive ion channel [Emcibacteraceae bacterium]
MNETEFLSLDEIIAFANEFYQLILNWLQVNLFTYESLIQLALIFGLFLISYLVARVFSPFMHKVFEEKPLYQKIEKFLKAMYLPLIWWFLVFIAWQVAVNLDGSIIFLRMATSLISMWIVIRLVTLMIESETISSIITVVAWSMVTLNIFGLLGPFTNLLSTTTFTMGTNVISILAIITGMISMVVLIWAALIVSSAVEGKLREAPTVTPSARVLLSKLMRIVLVVLAFLFAISSMGIDLTALAVFGGAIGVGLGFGLQKVVSNFISGVILLLDKSIKPGDVIEISGTYGRINKLAARYTSVISRDGREHLVPNEDIITQPVINWTFSDKKVRLHLPLNVSYNSDLEKAMDLMLEAAMESSRIIKNPLSRVLIKGFGDNGIDLELRMWIRDSENGVSNISSEVYLSIWHKFNGNNIEFPYPQRDVHIVSNKSLAEEL